MKLKEGKIALNKSKVKEAKFDKKILTITNNNLLLEEIRNKEVRTKKVNKEEF